MAATNKPMESTEQARNHHLYAKRRLAIDEQSAGVTVGT
jgi:hypothetical protein